MGGLQGLYWGLFKFGPASLLTTSFDWNWSRRRDSLYNCRSRRDCVCEQTFPRSIETARRGGRRENHDDGGGDGKFKLFHLISPRCVYKHLLRAACQYRRINLRLRQRDFDSLRNPVSQVETTLDQEPKRALRCLKTNRSEHTFFCFLVGSLDKIRFKFDAIGNICANSFYLFFLLRFL